MERAMHILSYAILQCHSENIYFTLCWNNALIGSINAVLINLSDRCSENYLIGKPCFK